MEQPNNKATKIIPLGQSMRLYYMRDKMATNTEILLADFERYMIASGLTNNTVITYAGLLRKMLLNLFFSKNPRFYDLAPQHQKLSHPPTRESFMLSRLEISDRNIESYLLGKSNIYKSMILVFLRFIKYKYNKQFTSIDFPKIPGKDKPTLPTLNLEQINEVTNAMPSDWQTFTKVLFISGARISELFRLKVRDVELKEWRKNKLNNESNTKTWIALTLRITKSKRDRESPLPPDLINKIFSDIRKRTKQPIKPKTLLFDRGYRRYCNRKMRQFIKKNKGARMGLSVEKLHEWRVYRIKYLYMANKAATFRKLLKEACKKIKLDEDISPHTFRRSRATILSDAGMQLKDIQLLLGHASIKTTEGYIKPDNRNLRITLENLVIE